jgi:hypothetical protein
MKDPNNLLIQQADGTFKEEAHKAGTASMARSRGAAMVDLNKDGRLDLAVVNRRVPMQVYRNITSTDGNWVAIDLHQDGANTIAVGAWIEIKAGERVLSREITVGGGHAGGATLPEHFGLGDISQVQIRVIWPDGVTSHWSEALAGQAIRVDRQGGDLALSQVY